ncbi:hypothetical protein E3E12_02710 [Formicincola oecophyllae]|uniref:Uncharacterized protein n=1 Tax=Formicincola oecophyllae TaxID=2558361 RepID=A0A4Y6U804_9PROT|nr:hypothetical protein [Formicincola oecophyllae]QDH13294.1 hypothetical protein E3E12_02710 [Formicincola oecophyllae]
MKLPALFKRTKKEAPPTKPQVQLQCRISKEKGQFYIVAEPTGPQAAQLRAQLLQEGLPADSWRLKQGPYKTARDAQSEEARKALSKALEDKRMAMIKAIFKSRYQARKKKVMDKLCFWRRWTKGPKSEEGQPK